MGFKGHERSFNEFINDNEIPAQLRTDAVAIGQAVNSYYEKGDSIENIITHSVGKIDKEVELEILHIQRISYAAFIQPQRMNTMR